MVDCGHNEIRTGYPELIAAAEFPVIDTSCLGLMDLARAVHQHGYKVALTGEGADEWLAGYSWCKIHKLLGWMDNIPGVPLGYGLCATCSGRVAGMPRFGYRAYRNTQRQMGGPNGYGSTCTASSARTSCDSSPGAGARGDPGLRSAFDDLELADRTAKRWHPVNRHLYFGGRVMLPGHLHATKGDRVAMHSSVETRYAFLDEDVIAFMAKIHPRWKLRGIFRDKFIERKVAERWLPHDVALPPQEDVSASRWMQLGRSRGPVPTRVPWCRGSIRCCRRNRSAKPGTSTPRWWKRAGRNPRAGCGRGLHQSRHGPYRGTRHAVVAPPVPLGRSLRSGSQKS